MKTIGITVCEAGYLAISLDKQAAGYWLLEDNEALYQRFEAYDRIFVDIPIGLQTDQENRECDMLLRKRLGPDYDKEIISPPIRAAISAPTFGEASAMTYEEIGQKLSMQSWSIVGEVRLLDQFLQENTASREQIFESHSELLFQILNGGHSILQKKATKKGLRHRLHLLTERDKHVDDFFRDIKEEYRRNQVEEDKIIDAMALALFAAKSADTPIQTIPENPSVDAKGLVMAFHYA